MKYSINFEFEEKDIEKRNQCSCCLSKNLKVLSKVKALSKEDKLTTYLETSLCKECGHIERSKILSQKWMLKMFNYRHSEQLKCGFNPINEKVEKFRYERYKKIGLKILNEFQNKKNEEIKIIDIGCGTGIGIKAWIDMGLQAIGIEPDSSRARIGIKKGVKIETKTWESFNFQSSNACVYTSIQSLEHFYTADKLLDCFYKNLNSNSLLYLEVPDAMNHITDWNDSLYLGHVHNYSENSLITLLQRIGFKSIKRVFPYEEEELNKNNLCIFAKKSENEWEDNLTNWDKKFLEKYNAKKTFDSIKGVPNEINPEKCLNYQIDKKLNDLMFSYKATKDVEFSVKDNQSGRRLEKIGENIIKVI